MIVLEKVNESYGKLSFLEESNERRHQLIKLLTDALSYYVENHRFMPAVKAKKWDGKIKLFNAETGSFSLGVIYEIVGILKKFNFQYNIKNKDYFTDKSFRDLTKESIDEFARVSLKLPYKLRHYQIDAIYDLLRWNKGLVISPTSSGKSLIMYVIATMLQFYKSDMRKLFTDTLIIVPQISLVEQLYGDFQEYSEMLGRDNITEMIDRLYGGKETKLDKPILISTWQSLESMDKDYFKRFGCVIVDEVHGASAKVLNNIVKNCTRAKYKIGMTGTLPDKESVRLELTGLFGKFFKYVTTKQLSEEGSISNIKIKVVIVKHTKANCEAVKLNNDYHAERAFILGVQERTNLICNIAKKATKNTLILFRDVAGEYGKRIAETLKSNTSKTVLYLDGKSKVEDREEARRIAENDNDVVIVASLGIFSTGVNIKNLHYLILAEPVKSKVKLLQSIGRILRLHENKDKAVFVDIVDDMRIGKRSNYLYEHFEERMRQYSEQGFEYDVKEFVL